MLLVKGKSTLIPYFSMVYFNSFFRFIQIGKGNTKLPFTQADSSFFPFTAPQRTHVDTNLLVKIGEWDYEYGPFVSSSNQSAIKKMEVIEDDPSNRHLACSNGFPVRLCRIVEKDE